MPPLCFCCALQRLYQAVRRMAFVKTYHAFVSWRELVAAKKEVALHYHHLTVSALSHMQVPLISCHRLSMPTAGWHNCRGLYTA